MGLELAFGESKDVREVLEIERKRLGVDKLMLDAMLDIADILGSVPVAYFKSVSANGVKIQSRGNGGIKHMELREGQQVTATVALVTKKGHPASYEKGSAKWESSDPAVSVTPVDGDELSATITGEDGSANAAAVVKFTADGDPDADQVRDIVATLDVVCTQGEATVATISTGTPSDVPDVPDAPPAPTV